ncbi:MAG: helix-turn-helix domain-containing protein [Proteobacteria bacterium]|nr:helix-turn-helix domain-containing protein [Pseudomonadota bacterium]
MYLQGVKEIEIARQLRKSRHTITNWKKKYNWRMPLI